MTAMFPLPVWIQGTTQPATPVNDSFLRTEVLARGATSIVSTPPASPADGQVHIVGPSPTGAWSTFAQHDVVLWRSGTWYRFAPFLGWLKQVGTDVRRFDGTGWVVVSGGGGGAVPVQDEGTTVVTAPTAINFVGAGVTVTDVGGVATANIPGATGGLAQYTEARNTAAPNATVPVHSITASGPEANIDAVFAQKGDGAIAREVSDGAVAGGNKRGSNAADFQSIRAAATQVASGAESFIGAGRNNTASGSNSGVIAGQTNSATAQNSAVLGGNNNTASGQRAVCLGGNTGTASGNDSASIAGGNANAEFAVAIGPGSNANGVVGAYSESTGSGPPRSRFTLHGSTTNATPLVLTTNGAAAAATNQVSFGNPNNRSGIYRGLVVARQTGNGGAKKSWQFVAHLDSDNAVHSLVAAVTPTVVADSGVGWSIAITADSTNNALVVTATGAAGATIRWACFVDGQEVAGT